MPHRAFHQCFRRRCAVFFQQFFFQRTAVYPNADGNIFGFARFHYRPNTAFIPNVARIDPYFVDSRRHTFQCQPVIEMDIRHQGDLDLALMASTRRTASISGIATRTISHPAFSKSRAWRIFPLHPPPADLT